MWLGLAAVSGLVDLAATKGSRLSTATFMERFVLAWFDSGWPCCVVEVVAHTFTLGQNSEWERVDNESHFF